MLLADGVVPANDGRGYVLRRVIRRAMLHARRLGPAVHLSSGVPLVARLLGSVYPEVKTQADRIAEVVRSEEERFGVALRQGMERLQPLLERGTLNPQEVFYLHDTLGFPIELTAELASEKGVTVDLEAVAALMQVQRDRSRVATRSEEHTSELQSRSLHDALPISSGSRYARAWSDCNLYLSAELLTRKKCSTSMTRSASRSNLRRSSPVRKG